MQWLLIKPNNLFESNNIYTHSELEARHEIELEKYIKKVQIESRIMGELATSHILPAAIRYQNMLANNIKGLERSRFERSMLTAIKNKSWKKYQMHINKTSDLVEKMIEARKICNAIWITQEPKPLLIKAR